MAQQLPSGASTSFRNMDFFADLEGSFRDLSFQSPSSSSHSMLASYPNQNRLDFGPWGIPSPSPTLERGVPLASPLGRYGMVRGTPNSSRAARMAAIRDSMGSQVVWSGTLPPRNCKQDSSFSCKVFLGGVPWDITDFDLQKIFSVFGPLRVEWPGVHDRSATQRPKGHFYLIFECESSVVNLLGRCSYDFHNNQHNWFYRVASKRMMGKSAQVIPWQLGDATYSLHGYVPTPGRPYRIFVANLHGMITAEGLGRIMNDLFGGVIAATLDTDKTKYPIGSGRVTFNNPTSHLKAIRAETVEVRTAKFTRKINTAAPMMGFGAPRKLSFCLHGIPLVSFMVIFAIAAPLAAGQVDASFGATMPRWFAGGLGRGAPYWTGPAESEFAYSIGTPQYSVQQGTFGQIPAPILQGTFGQNPVPVQRTFSHNPVPVQATFSQIPGQSQAPLIDVPSPSTAVQMLAVPRQPLPDQTVQSRNLIKYQALSYVFKNPKFTVTIGEGEPDEIPVVEETTTNQRKVTTPKKPQTPA